MHGVRAVSLSFSRGITEDFSPGGASQVAGSVVRIYMPVQERWVRREDLLEEELVVHSSILAWRISWTEEPGALQSMGL